MAIQSSFYAPDGSTRTFPSTKHIASKQHMAVWYRRISDGVWEVQNVSTYELINNTAVLVEAPSVTLYDNIEIRVVDSYDELLSSPSETSIVAGIAAEIVNVSDNMGEVQFVADNITQLVHKTGDETIGGVKTFTSSPVIPDATTAAQAVSKGQLDLNTVANVPDYAALQALDFTKITKVNLTELHTGITASGGVFTWNPLADKSTANPGTRIDPTVSLALQGTGVGLGCWDRLSPYALTGANVMWYGATGDGVTDDTVAIQNTTNSGERIVIFPQGNFLISATINIPSLAYGITFKGVSGKRFSGSLNVTKITMSAANTWAFQYVDDNTSGQIDAFNFEGIWLISDKGLKYNPHDELVTDGIGATFPYLMRPIIKNCTFQPITVRVANSYAILASKTFDFIFEDCEFTQFDLCVWLQGCDLGSIHNCRFTSFGGAAIRDQSASSFGSQNEIRHNDMVIGNTATAFIQTSSRHVRIYDNYMEVQSPGAIDGFIDMSYKTAYDIAPNTSGGAFASIDVQGNRLDGMQYCTAYLYNLDLLDFPTYGNDIIIKDVNTNGVAPTVPWLNVVGGSLPVRTNLANMRSYDLSGGYYGDSSYEQEFTTFKTSNKFSEGRRFVVNNENLINCNRSELTRNNAIDHVGMVDDGILLKSSLNATLFHVVLPRRGGLENPWLLNTATYTVTITARAKSGTQNLTGLKVVNAAGVSATVSKTLTTQFDTIVFTFTGVTDIDTVGMVLTLGAGAVNDVIVKSIEYERV